MPTSAGAGAFALDQELRGEVVGHGGGFTGINANLDMLLDTGYIAVVEADFSQYILLVDDYDQWEQVPAWGTDADRDAFYDSLLYRCERPVVEWNPEEHMAYGLPQPPDVATLAAASTVIWYADSVSGSIRCPERIDRRGSS